MIQLGWIAGAIGLAVQIVQEDLNQKVKILIQQYDDYYQIHNQHGNGD